MIDATAMAAAVYIAVNAVRAWLPLRWHVGGERSVAIVFVVGAILGVGGVGLGFFPGMGIHDWRDGLRAGVYAAVGASGIHGLRSVTEERSAQRKGRSGG